MGYNYARKLIKAGAVIQGGSCLPSNRITPSILSPLDLDRILHRPFNFFTSFETTPFLIGEGFNSAFLKHSHC